MTQPETSEADLFVTLSPEEYARVPVPSKEEILDTLRRGRAELRAALAAPRACHPRAGLRYRRIGFAQIGMDSGCKV